MEEIKVEESPLNQPLEIPIISESHPPQAQNQTLEVGQQNDNVKIEEEDETMKEDSTIPSIQTPNAKLTTKIPLHRSTIQRIQNMYKNFSAKPILSSKKESFLSHEAVFRALNLWEFLNLDFDSEVRSDLIVELICTYNGTKYCGFVRGYKISVGKSDLAQALKVPVERNETHESIYRKDETKDMLLKFLSSFVLLDDEDEDDDMTILPEEIIQAIELVRNGTANEVNWCELIWGLVEKDIVDAYNSGYCKFASYLQCLIKTVAPNLLLEDVYVPEPDSVSDVSEATDSVESSLLRSDEDEEADDEEDEDEYDDEIQDYQGMELSLGENGNMALMNDDNWNDGGCNEGFEFGLRRCDSNDVSIMEFENFCKAESPMKPVDCFANMERLNPTDLYSYKPQMNFLDQNVGPSCSNFFDDSIIKGKRHVGAADIDVYYHENNQQKRMRINTHWEEPPLSGFDSYMEQMLSSIGKARMLFVEKEQKCVNAHFQLQRLNEMLMQKDEVIRNLEKTQLEEQQAREFMVDKYRHELNVLANLTFSYRKALKETQKKFDDYRKMCPEGDEFLYHDVSQTGGLVLTSKQIEKMKLEREEEMKLIAVKIVNAFECEWLVKFEEYKELFVLYGMKLAELKEKVQCIKERIIECKSKSS